MLTLKRKFQICIGLSVALLSGCGCSFSTANLSSVKLSKDKPGTQVASSFNTGDTIYAIAEAANIPGKIKVTGRIVIEEVEGQQKGPVPGLETTLDLDGSATATFTFSPPTAGWPKGKYKVDVILIEDGEQKDQKSASFTIS